MRVFSSRWCRSTTPFGHSVTMIPGSSSGSYTHALPYWKQISRLSSVSGTAGPTRRSVVLAVMALLLPVVLDGTCESDTTACVAERVEYPSRQAPCT